MVNLNNGPARTGLHLAIGTMSIFFAEVLIIPAGFITAIFLARRLGPILFGLFAVAGRLIELLEWLGSALFSGATVKFVAESKEWRHVGTAVVRLHLIVGGGLALLLFLAATPLSLMFQDPAMANYIRLFAVEIPIFSLSRAHSNILFGLGQFKKRAGITAVYGISRLILIVIFVEMGLSVHGAILGSIGASLVELVVCRYYVRPSFFTGPTFAFRRLWGFAAPLFLSTVSKRIFRLDLLFLKVLGGTAAHAGFYGAAQTLSMSPTLISKSLSSPLISTLSRLLSNGEAERARDIGLTAMRGCVLLVPFAAMMAGAASEIVDFVFGSRYLPAGTIVSILIFAGLGLLCINTSISILTAFSRPGWAFAITGPMVPLAVTGHLIFIPLMGGPGAALVTTSVAIMGAIVSAFAVYGAWRVFPPLKTVLRSIFCGGIAFGLAMIWSATGFFILFKLLVITLVIFFFFIVMGEFTTREIARVRSVLKWKRQGELDKGSL